MNKCINSFHPALIRFSINGSRIIAGLHIIWNRHRIFPRIAHHIDLATSIDNLIYYAQGWVTRSEEKSIMESKQVSLTFLWACLGITKFFPFCMIYMTWLLLEARWVLFRSCFGKILRLTENLVWCFFRKSYKHLGYVAWIKEKYLWGFFFL